METVGVDEAGKGPVLGSMFAAAVCVPSPDVLPDGIRDSKDLPPARREELARRLRADDRIAVAVTEIAPERIDDPATDMNTLTVEAHAEAIGGVADGVTRAVVDAGDVDAGRFARRIEERVPGVEIRAEHGADAAHRIVGAASIVAKVERDAHVTRLAAEYGEIGSGYPSDPKTRGFLREYVAEHGELPACARASWGTSEDVLAAAEQSALRDF